MNISSDFLFRTFLAF